MSKIMSEIYMSILETNFCNAYSTHTGDFEQKDPHEHNFRNIAFSLCANVDDARGYAELFEFRKAKLQYCRLRRSEEKKMGSDFIK